jgi:predicted SAM-dependent methyltransferase
MNLNVKKRIRDTLPFAVRGYHAARLRIKLAKSKRWIGALLQRGQPIFLEVGSGDKHGTNGWVTVDMTEGCDLFWDLRLGIPFPVGSISKIYSSHFLEHLSYGEGQQFLGECLRALAPGGSFLICVPNARYYLEAYVNGTPLDTDVWCAYRPAFNDTTAIDLVNYTAYMDGHHKYMFDPENLLHRLTAAGFRNACLRPFDPELDLIDRDFESIYAEAEK